MCTKIETDNTIFSTLLLKYINHVRRNEGIDFIDKGFRFDGDFSDNEWTVLTEMARKLD